jgi:hypothetical protein
MLDVWRGMGMKVVGEAFADRRYEPDGTLRSRKFPDALITDPKEAAAQALRHAREGKAQTVCVHGDTPGAVAILTAGREVLGGRVRPEAVGRLSVGGLRADPDAAVTRSNVRVGPCGQCSLNTTALLRG